MLEGKSIEKQKRVMHNHYKDTIFNSLSIGIEEKTLICSYCEKINKIPLRSLQGKWCPGAKS